MNERDKYINELVASEQAQRTYARDCVEVEKYCEGRDKVVPYVAPIRDVEQVPDTGALTPSQKRGLKMIMFVAPTISISVGLCHVIMTGALNTVFGWCIGGGFVVAIISGAFSGGGSLQSSAGNCGGGNTYNTFNQSFNQYNNFGSNPNQKNG